jgi:hypothetical protein
MSDRASSVCARLAAVILAVACLVSGGPAVAQRSPVATERFFKLEWHVERRDGQDVAIAGHLRNDYVYALRDVELQLQVLDGAGQIAGETFGRIDRAIPPGTTVSFRLPLRETGARYAVLVYAFQFGDRESP